MEGKTYTLLHPMNDRETAAFHEVPGKWIDVIPGWETFIWSDEDQDLEGLEAPFDVFHLVEARSGRCFGRGFDEEQAIESGKAHIANRGKVNLYIEIQNSISKYGISPAFRIQEGS